MARSSWRTALTSCCCTLRRACSATTRGGSQNCPSSPISAAAAFLQFVMCAESATTSASSPAWPGTSVFTGIIEAVGKVLVVEPATAGVRIVVDAGSFDLSEVKIGDSVAIDGVCLTAVALGAGRIEFDVSAETLACTAGYARDAHVNLEKPLRLADRLGGHLVSGHVDGIGVATRFEAAGD